VNQSLIIDEYKITRLLLTPSVCAYREKHLYCWFWLSFGFICKRNEFIKKKKDCRPLIHGLKTSCSYF